MISPVHRWRAVHVLKMMSKTSFSLISFFCSRSLFIFILALASFDMLLPTLANHVPVNTEIKVRIRDVSKKTTVTMTVLGEEVYSNLSKNPDTDFSRVQVMLAGAEAVPVALVNWWHERGVIIQEGYGMSEISAFHWACPEGRYHVQPWVIPFLLDPGTSQPLPQEGRQTGRAAFYDFPKHAGSGHRFPGPPGSDNEITEFIGFRVARTLTP